MTEPSRVVFLSYASQDAAAAQRIADALRTAGIEVWLDQSQLRGGDAWDRHIRDRIRECRLFIALISAHTEARDEGYFRREWKLAVERTHDMSERKAFLVPVVIDDTAQRGASVPEKFRDVQWTAVPRGETPPEFIDRIAHLLSLEPRDNVSHSGRAPSGAASGDLSVRPNAEAVAPELTAAHGQRGPSSPIEEHDLRRSVAVLPFANLSSDREQEYFSDGLTEELINHLAHVRGLRVLARTSSFAFKGKNEDLRVIGRKLAVGCIVEGSVRRAGNRLRITAQLLDCGNGYHLWSETFDRELDDVFQIQNDISHSVASALGVALGIAASQPSGGTRNLEAYDLYLRAQSLHNLIGPAELKRAAALYRQALALDPEFALAWSGLAATLRYIGAFLPETAAAVRGEQADAVGRGLAIAPDIAATQLAHAMWQADRHDWITSERAARRATELSAGMHSAARTLTMTLTCVGRVEEAVLHARTCRAADPLSLAATNVLQIVLTVAGRDEEADAEYLRSRDLMGDRSAIEDLAMRRASARGASVDELRACTKRFLAHDSVPTPVQHELVELLGEPEVARVRLHRAFEDAAYQDPTRQFRLALWAAQFGDVDLALSALRRAYVDAQSWTVYLIWMPTYRAVRKDVRFKELLRDLKIVDYWCATGNWGDFARPLGNGDFEVW